VADVARRVKQHGLHPLHAVASYVCFLSSKLEYKGEAVEARASKLAWIRSCVPYRGTSLFILFLFYSCVP